MTPAHFFHPVVGALEDRIDTLHERQQGYEAAVQRVEDKLDALKYWIMGGLLGGVGLGASATGALMLFVLGKR